MNVRELIEKLKTLSGDDKVKVAYEGQVRDVVEAVVQYPNEIVLSADDY